MQGILSCQEDTEKCFRVKRLVKLKTPSYGSVKFLALLNFSGRDFAPRGRVRYIYAREALNARGTAFTTPPVSSLLLPKAIPEESNVHLRGKTKAINGAAGKNFSGQVNYIAISAYSLT